MIDYIKEKAALEVRFAQKLFNDCGVTFEYVQVFPCLNEGTKWLESIISLNLSILVIVVINKTVCNSKPDDLNLKLQEFCRLQGSAVTDGNTSLITGVGKDKKTGILVVDRFTEGKRLGPLQGVGMARKIGCDIAVSAISNGIVESQWIRCGDADAEYFSCHYDDALVTQDADTHFAVFPVEITRGSSSDMVYEVSKLLDANTKYYVNQFKKAGHYYGQSAPASAIVFKAQNYCDVGGFDDVTAHEDSRLRDKICFAGSKWFDVPCQPILIEARESSRCSAGTGMSVIALIGNTEKLIALTHVQGPLLFDVLGGIIAGIKPDTVSDEIWNVVKVQFVNIVGKRAAAFSRLDRLVKILTSDFGLKDIQLEGYETEGFNN